MGWKDDCALIRLRQNFPAGPGFCLGLCRVRATLVATLRGAAET
jgi:hypothetical protein